MIGKIQGPTATSIFTNTKAAYANTKAAQQTNHHVHAYQHPKNQAAVQKTQQQTPPKAQTLQRGSVNLLA
ncbi:MAG: hypothetical protein WBM07_07265 [Chitinivibrionales bacterium]